MIRRAFSMLLASPPASIKAPRKTWNSSVANPVDMAMSDSSEPSCIALRTSNATPAAAAVNPILASLLAAPSADLPKRLIAAVDRLMPPLNPESSRLNFTVTSSRAIIRFPRSLVHSAFLGSRLIFVAASPAQVGHTLAPSQYAPPSGTGIFYS